MEAGSKMCHKLDGVKQWEESGQLAFDIPDLR